MWCAGEGNRLPADAVVYTENPEETRLMWMVLDKNNNVVDDSTKTLKILSDRVDPREFYGFEGFASFMRRSIYNKSCPGIRLF